MQWTDLCQLQENKKDDDEVLSDYETDNDDE